ncbi:peptidase inhibitor family I36 [Nocardia tenerifensis]|uniref:Peptidase inhibitor family I36 n=1 Tax=Nocardia tenerifensis TaxID=228006 RepID=A0A318JMV0_9NOCA|nr:peptidase inhibitor family I36 protein [Nocardia tenerifensis]PXX55628.1 peptidase inhibitor family I36 [Nocardia tenerifensis]
MRLRELTVTALLVLGISGLAAPAQAATGYDRCPDGNFCLFSAANGGGRIAYFRLGSTDLRLQNIDGQAYSLWNRTGRFWDGFTEYNYRGGVIFRSGPGQQSNIPADVATQVHSVKAA